MIYAGYVKVAQGKPQSGRVKWKISPGTGEAIVSLKEKIHWVCYRGVSKCNVSVLPYLESWL